MGIDAEAAAVLVVARPGDDEVPGPIDRDRREQLVVGGGRVDLELAAGGDASCVIPLGKDTPAAAVLGLVDQVKQTGRRASWRHWRIAGS